jgi:UDP-2,3-diacylglucosamine pyrophosphatase LpxH
VELIAGPEVKSVSRGIRAGLFFSDVHLGWTLCSAHHAEWLRRLPAAADDAELIVLNGDVVDGHRRVQRSAERDLVHGLDELVGCWQQEGRTVVYLEGNHDPEGHIGLRLRPERWLHDCETDDGRRVRVLHGHRVAADMVRWGRYDRAGRRLLGLENRVYGRSAALRSVYRFGPGWITSAVGAIECTLARRGLPGSVAPLVADVDVLLHGHIHYGPGSGRIGRVATWRTGAWVSPGHLGSADRMLRYRAGRFERIAWDRGRWHARDDGR